jgi:hypothetical protein
MDLASLLPPWLDACLIAPFRWLSAPFLGVWLGSAFLCAYCVVIGEMTSALLFWGNRNYYTRLQDEVVKAHNLSTRALHAGDKEAYLAVNRQAHEHFGKAFFAQAALGMASLWPLPFALGWMSLRFSGIGMYSIPYTEKELGYVFVVLTLYIPARILFARMRKHLPGFRRVEDFRRKSAEARGAMRSLFSTQPE